MKENVKTKESPLELLPPPLLAWYRENARDLPWRRTEDAYRILVSEIMLQQTRVGAVLGYYAQFLERFPTVEALAGAPEDQLLKCWEGLGYYSRARNLQRAVRKIVSLGRFPDTYRELLTLPGVGEYTAGAVASAAFGRREAAVDGNVLRVVSRLEERREDVLDGKVRKDIRTRVQEVMPWAEADIRIFNQAMMELGATVCLPKGLPRCEACPAAPFCLGRLHGTAPSLPVRGKRKERRVEERTVFLLFQGGRVAMRRRPAAGLLAGLWEFPNVEGRLSEDGAAKILASWGLTPKKWRRQLTAKHIFTHVEWRMTGYALEVSGPGGAELFWADREALAERAVPSAFGRYHQEAIEQLTAGESRKGESGDGVLA